MCVCTRILSRDRCRHLVLNYSSCQPGLSAIAVKTAEQEVSPHPCGFTSSSPLFLSFLLSSSSLTDPTPPHYLSPDLCVCNATTSTNCFSPVNPSSSRLLRSSSIQPPFECAPPLPDSGNLCCVPTRFVQAEGFQQDRHRCVLFTAMFMGVRVRETVRVCAFVCH